jgi:hypothetical protein
MVNKKTIPKGHFPKIAFSSILFATLAFFMGLSWHSLSSYKRIKTFQKQDFRIQELAGIIIHLDEVLTMSARMGAQTGHIVYSVFKEVDFATNLLTGPYKDTNFARAFKEARVAVNKDYIKMVDFEFYEPSQTLQQTEIALNSPGSRSSIL